MIAERAAATKEGRKRSRIELKTASLVADTPYRHVRNPMISGVLAILLGEAALAASGSLLLWFAIFLTLQEIAIRFWEEPHLAQRYGSEYLDYRQNVPRWIPRLMFSAGMLTAFASSTALRSLGLPPGSPPPRRAAMVISLMSFVKRRPRLASSAPFLCLIVAHLLCPDIGVSRREFARIICAAALPLLYDFSRGTTSNLTCQNGFS